MTDEEDWDVLVVGGGPAGSCAARAASEGGARVLVVDRRETIGSPVHCAEHLARKVVMDHGFPKEAVAQDVECTRTFIAGEEASVRRSPGCILNREVADLVLWDRAGEAGATTMEGTRVSAIDGLSDGSYRVTMTTHGAASTQDARVLIGADGPRSTVGAALGVVNRSMVAANQVTVPLVEPSHDTEVYLDPMFAGGYAWLFPKGEVATWA
jgi:digeranylgeranylglycerophospholipid reductase